ncbi:MAG: hypothetical protein GX201_13280 [Clostridiales bacterium]|nr:hypothetical protein [Clostridiales bacterium]
MIEKTNNYCTIISKEYLIKGIALYDSISRYDDSFHLWICTMDKSSDDLMKRLNLPNTTVIHVSNIENSSLLEARKTRTTTEYCWTVKASFIKYIFKILKSIKSIIYLDADVYMFSQANLLFEQLKKNHVLLTSHNFSQRFHHLYKQKGRYNAGIIGFRNGQKGLELLDWWERKCIQWCYDQVTPSKFGDQKYLEFIGKRNTRVYIADSIASNAAMWNIAGSRIEYFEEKVYINREKLIFFHFSSFFILSEDEFDLWMWEQPKLDENVKEQIYLPYVRAIKNAIELIKTEGIDIRPFVLKGYNRESAGNYFRI